MIDIKKWGLVLAVFVVLVGGYFIFRSDSSLPSGAPTGTLSIENYVPAILYNGGYYSELPIQTTSDLSVAATSTFSGGCFTNNGADFCDRTDTFADATTTHVNFQNPWWGTATSTVTFAILDIDGAASTSQTFEVG